MGLTLHTCFLSLSPPLLWSEYQKMRSMECKLYSQQEGQTGRKIYLENARGRVRNGKDKHIKPNWTEGIDGRIDRKIEH